MKYLSLFVSMTFAFSAFANKSAKQQALEDMEIESVQQYSERDSLLKNHSKNLFKDAKGLEMPSFLNDFRQHPIYGKFTGGDTVILTVEVEDPEKMRRRYPDHDPKIRARSEILPDPIRLAQKQYQLYDLQRRLSTDPAFVAKVTDLANEAKARVDQMTKEFFNAKPGTKYQVTLQLGEFDHTPVNQINSKGEVIKKTVRVAQEGEKVQYAIAEFIQSGTKVVSLDRVPYNKVERVEKMMSKAAKGGKRRSKGAVGVATGAALAVGAAATANAEEKIKNTSYKPEIKTIEEANGSPGTR